jgi:acetyl esterase
MFAKNLFFLFLMTFAATNATASTIWEKTPQEMRELINQKIMALDAKRPEVNSVSDCTIEVEGRKTPLRVYKPNALQNLPLILMIHGGGWVAGNLDTHDNLARYLCRKARAVVVSVGYLNSPEGKFPLPLLQCYDALAWSIKEAHELNIDRARIALVGDSAGGLMAAALSQLVRDQQGPPITLQVLINPATDLSGNGTLQPQGDALDNLRWFATQYVKEPQDVYNPYCSPLLATIFKELPTTLVLLA